MNNPKTEEIVEALRCCAHRDAGFRPDLQPPRQQSQSCADRALCFKQV